MTDDERALLIMIARCLARDDQGCARPGEVSRFAEKVTELTTRIEAAARCDRVALIRATVRDG